MQPINVADIFLDAASEVLETMFFICVGSEEVVENDDQVLSAELAFRGASGGRFGIRVPRQTGLLFAANFLGLDEVTEEQAAEVVCELTNVLCGSVLSRLEPDARFELGHPQLDLSNKDRRGHEDAIGYTFGTDEGTLTMWMEFREPQLARPAA